jgi:hypothetical protein
MRIAESTYVVAPALAVLLLTGCGGSTLFSSPSATQQSQSRAAKHGLRSCLYVFPDYEGPRTLAVWAQLRSGKWAQIREISDSRLNDPQDFAVDGDGSLYVTNSASQSVTVYAAGATGHVKPIREIQGSATELDRPRDLAFDQSNNELYVANPYNNSITIYPALANGNVAPIGVISGSATGLNGPEGLTLDASGNIYASNLAAGSSLSSITVYAAGSTGNVTPMRTIAGSLTKLRDAIELALDSSGNVYAANAGNDPARLTVYAAGANGNVAPIRRIHGHLTTLRRPFGIAVDSSDNIYEASYKGFPIKVWAAGSNGNVPPSYELPVESSHRGIRILPCK